MNKHRYRLIFNQVRRIMMVVAEHVSTRVANTNDTTASATTAPIYAGIQPIKLALMLLLGSAMVISNNAQADIIADGAAPGNQQPMITNTANGLPLVNIQTPSAAGVSRNLYSQFDIDAQGAILNNSNANVQTQLGGWVQGNPYLAGGTARVILNEVNSSNPSLLNGFIEIAGSRAQLVIANPAGISCDGCGFINANRATLTTGTPIINGGNLIGYRVGGGSINFLGQGMDASNANYTDVIARAVEVNAGIWANELNITTGTNEVRIDSNGNQTSVTATTPSTTATHAFAIDVAALGGMYAGKIHMIGTEAGLGVRNAATLGASVGEFTVSVNGELINTGSMGGVTQTAITATNISNQGEILSGGDITINAQSLDNQTAAEIAGANTNIDLTGTLTNRGLIDGSDTFITADAIHNLGTGAIFGDHLALTATSLTNESETISGITKAGVLAARTQLDIGADTITNQDGALIFSSDDMAIGGALDTNHLATGQATLLTNDGATVEALGGLGIAATDIQNLNSELVTAWVQDSSVFHQEIRPEDWPYQYDISFFPTINNYGIELQRRVNELGQTVQYFEDYTYYEWTAVTSSTHVLSSNPGQILSGGDMVIAGNLFNSDSQIIAGGALTTYGGTLDNIATAGLTSTVNNGRRQFRDWDGDDEELDFGGWASYNPATINVSFDLNTNAFAQNTAPTSTGTTVGSLTTPSSSLFVSSTDPTATYLIETDSRFSNYRTWLSSDYMMQQMAFDPAITQKRLGDGFYEQKLVREQIGQLTGRRFLDGYASDEAQYQALMSNGLTMMNALQLIPGIALTAEQVAQLTSDIVWMVEREVTLADGSITKALVPQVYVRPQANDFDPTIGILAGNTVQINTTGDIKNSGTIAGRTYVALNGDNLQNLGGIIHADTVVAQAGNDINNMGGTIAAKDMLYLDAGNNINVESTTQSSSQTVDGSSYRRTNLDRVAGLYVTDPNGLMYANAGNDINTKAAVLNSAGDMQLVAANNIDLNVVDTTTSEKLRGGGLDMDNQTLVQEVSKLTSGGNMVLQVGGDIAGTGTQITSGGAATLDATNVSIVSATNVATSSYELDMNGKEQKGQSTGVIQQAPTIRTGNNLDVNASENILVASGDIKVGGDASFIAGNQIAMLSTVNMIDSSYEKEQSGGWGGKSLENGSFHSETNVVTQIETGGNLTMISGGAQTHEATIGKVGGDLTILSLSDEVRFKAVKDVVSRSLTKSDSDLAWQSMSGKGSTDETLQMTQFSVQGQSVIDAAKNIQIDIKQIDKQTVTQTIDALVAQNPNLAWLKEMDARGDIDWHQVKELHDSWEYEQSGLGQGAALAITIAVAAMSGGAGAGMIGATQGTMAAAAANAAYVSIVSNTIISTVNNRGNLGDIFKDITSSDALKGYATDAATAAFTAGVLDEKLAGQTDNELFKRVSHGFDLSTPAGIAGFAQYTAVEAITSATIQTGISGGSFNENLQYALKGAAIQVAGAALYNQVGNLGQQYDLPDGSIEKTALHAVVGGLLSEAAGGDFATGAIAAGANELLAKQLSEVFADKPQYRTLATQLLALASTAVSGGDPNLAVQIADVADTYNRQLHYFETVTVAQAKEGKSEDEQHRIDAAACALIQCASGLSAADPSKVGKLALQAEGANYLAEQNLLIKKSNGFIYSSNDAEVDYWTSRGYVRGVDGTWGPNLNQTATLGVGGTGILGYGGTAGIGLYVNKSDAGLYVFKGTGYGFDPSFGIQTGMVNWDASLLRANTTYINLGVDFGGVGAGGSIVTLNNEVVGGTLNLGIRGVPAMPGGTASATKATTCTLGASNFISYLNGQSQSFCQ